MKKQQLDVKKFLVKLMIFSLPFLIIFGFSTGILIASQELLSIESLIKLQSQSRQLVLFGLSYSNPTKYYKLKSVVIRKPTILTLGTSRVMQFRSAFFKPNSRFFNAGGGVEKIKEFRQFLDQITPGNEPQIIIIGLDQYLFNPNWDDLNSSLNSQQIYQPLSRLETWKFGSLRVLSDFWQKKFSLSDLTNFRSPIIKVGLNAKARDNGFRNDGSYYYGRFIHNPQTTDDPNFQDTLSRIANGEKPYNYGNTVSPGALDELRLFLTECQSRNIYVIGFLPPYPPRVYAQFKSFTDKFSYMFMLAQELKPIFQAYNFGFYDFTDAATFGSNDQEAVDGLHPSEKAYLRLIINLAASEPKLRQHMDLKYLKTRLNQSPSGFFVFAPDEL